MPVNANATVRANRRPYPNGPSIATTSTLTLAISKLTDIGVLTVVFGHASTRPTTYADFLGTDFWSALQFDSGTYAEYDSGNFYRARLQSTAVGAQSGLEVGDHCWVGIFEDASPSGGDAPDLVLGPFVVIA